MSITTTTRTAFQTAYGMGRCGYPGYNATVFGAYGFLGRYLCEELGNVGTCTYIPYRGCSMEVRHLKLMYELGNTGFIPFHPFNDDSIRKSVEKSDIVFNLIGKNYETRHIIPTRRPNGKLSRVNFTFHDVNVEIPRRIAKIAKQAGASTFVHMSTITARPDSLSEWARTKYEGELAVLSEFPEATIVRCADIHGDEDKFVNTYVRYTALYHHIPLVEGGEGKVQPIHVHDVSKVLFEIIYHPELRGKFIELAGNDVYTHRELAEFIVDVSHLSCNILNLSVPASMLLASFMGVVTHPINTRDIVLRRLENNILRPDSTAVKIQDFGIDPLDFETMAFPRIICHRKDRLMETVKVYNKAAEI